MPDSGLPERTFAFDVLSSAADAQFEAYELSSDTQPFQTAGKLADGVIDLQNPAMQRLASGVRRVQNQHSDQPDVASLRRDR